MTTLSEWRISNSAIAKILTTIFVCYLVMKLSPLLTLLALALLGACTIYPVIRWIERFLPHWAAALIVSALVILALVGIVAGVIPTLSNQFALAAQKLPELYDQVLKNLPDGMGKQMLERILKSPAISTEHLMAVGQAVFGAVAELVIVVVLALYLAADGKRTYDWLLAFFSSQNQAKLNETTKEVSSIVVAYVVGQFVTSLLCGTFVFVVLQILHVPAALVLAVLAAVFDVLPMLGFFLFTVPACLFALTVSPAASFTVLIVYLGYHLLENYFIVPKIYGNRLRLSDLVVLLAVLSGAALAGIPGAILFLPLVAIYPAVERIWLSDYLGKRVVQKHAAIEGQKD